MPRARVVREHTICALLHCIFWLNQPHHPQSLSPTNSSQSDTPPSKIPTFLFGIIPFHQVLAFPNSSNWKLKLVQPTYQNFLLVVLNNLILYVLGIPIRLTVLYSFYLFLSGRFLKYLIHSGFIPFSYFDSLWLNPIDHSILPLILHSQTSSK